MYLDFSVFPVLNFQLVISVIILDKLYNSIYSLIRFLLDFLTIYEDG